MISLPVTLVILRLFTAVVFAIGAVTLMFYDKTGWGWCVLASILLGCVTATEVKD